MLKRKLWSLALLCGAVGLCSLVTGSMAKTVLADTISQESETLYEGEVSNSYESGVLTTDDGYKYTIDTTTNCATVVGYKGTEKALVIPSQVKGYEQYTVTKIGAEAFKYSRIESVVIPATITEIGNYAFVYSDVKYVVINEGSEEAVIGYGAFSNSDVSGGVVIPGNYKVIGEYAFNNCSNLLGVEYSANPSGDVTQKIMSYAFNACYNLKSVRLSTTISEIADNAFEDSWKVYFWGNLNEYVEAYAKEHVIDWVISQGETESGFTYNVCYGTGNATITGYTGSLNKLDIPSQVDGYTVTKIGRVAFYQNKEIEYVSIPSTVTVIKEKAFQYCTNLIEVNIAEGVEDAIIESKAFAITHIERLVIPGNYKSIGEEAFYACLKLLSVEYGESPSGVADQVIGDKAFSDTDSLERVKLPSTILSIAEYVFDRDNIVYFEADANKYVNEYVENYAKTHDIDVVIGQGESESGYTYNISKEGAIITGYTGTSTALAIPSKVDGYNVVRIGKRAFYNKEIKSVVIPEGVKLIHTYAFHAADIETLVLPSTITKICESAFCCQNLTEIELKKGNEDVYIGKDAFQYTDITSITIPANYTYIDSFAFYKCEYLETVVFATDGVERENQYIAKNAFEKCKKLKSVIMPPTINNIYDATEKDTVFYGCSSFTIYGIEGSAAKDYATKMSIPFATLTNTAALNTYTKIAAVGDTLVMNTVGSSGYGQLKYRYIMYNRDTQVWKALTDEYVTDTLCLWTIDQTGNIDFFVDVMDEVGIVTRSNALSVEVKKELKKLELAVSVDNENVLLGDTVKITADVANEESSYTYSYIAHNKDTGEWFRFDEGNFVDRNYLEWNALTVGAREFYVEVKDEVGRIVRSTPIYVNVYEYTLNDKTTSQTFEVGDEITLKIDAPVGNGELTYKFVMYDRDTNSWTVIRDYEITNTCTYTLETAGDKEFKVYIKDSTGKKVSFVGLKIEVDEPLEFTVIVDGLYLEEGELVKITVEATGGMAPYKYAYYALNMDTDEVIELEADSTSNTYIWKATKAGRYFFDAEVLDVKGKEGKPINNLYTGVCTDGDEMYYVEDSEIMYDYTGLVENLNGLWYVVKGQVDFEYAGLVKHDGEWYYVKDGKGTKYVSVKVDNTSVVVGDKVKISANVTGGYGPYTYTYKVYNETTKKWGTLKSGTTLSEHTWKAGSAGTRVFYVEVTDATGKVVRSEGVTVVTAQELSVSATASIKTTVVGDKVRFTVTATGGLGSYKYSFIVYNKTTGKWARLKDEILSNTYTWTAKSEGTRVFYVEVTDATGKTVRSEGITIETAPKLSVTVNASDTTISKGEKVTFTATATGGTGKYTYSFLVYNFTTKKWYRYNESEFLESNTKTWKASGTGKRKFFVEVTDSNGKTVRSEGITITVK